MDFPPIPSYTWELCVLCILVCVLVCVYASVCVYGGGPYLTSSIIIRGRPWPHWSWSSLGVKLDPRGRPRKFFFLQFWVYFTPLYIHSTKKYLKPLKTQKNILWGRPGVKLDPGGSWSTPGVRDDPYTLSVYNISVRTVFLLVCVCSCVCECNTHFSWYILLSRSNMLLV